MNIFDEDKLKQFFSKKRIKDYNDLIKEIEQSIDNVIKNHK